MTVLGGKHITWSFNGGSFHGGKLYFVEMSSACSWNVFTNRARMFWREPRGSQGMGVVSSSWFDRLFCLLIIVVWLHVQTLMLTDVQTPFLGTPVVPLKLPIKHLLESSPVKSRFGVPWDPLSSLWTWIFPPEAPQPPPSSIWQQFPCGEELYTIIWYVLII